MNTDRELNRPVDNQLFWRPKWCKMKLNLQLEKSSGSALLDRCHPDLRHCELGRPCLFLATLHTHHYARCPFAYCSLDCKRGRGEKRAWWRLEPRPPHARFSFGAFLSNPQQPTRKLSWEYPEQLPLIWKSRGTHLGTRNKNLSLLLSSCRFWKTKGVIFHAILLLHSHLVCAATNYN